MDTYIKTLIQHNWIFKESKIKLLKDDITNYASGRLVKVQDNSVFFNFINSYNQLTNKNDDVWYLSINDYIWKKSDEEEFAWNDFEIESLEYADTKEEKKQITSFWENHLPLLLTVKDGYAFIGIILNEKDKGKIIFGREPEYEDIEIIADSLEEFFKLHTNYLEKREGPFFLKNFI